MTDQQKKLTVLWTSDNPITAKEMVFMYVTNAKKFGWWDDITLLIWGAATKLAATTEEFYPHFRAMQELGIHLTACKACSDDLGMTEILETLGIEVKYWGIGLTEVLQGNGTLLSV